MAQPVKRVAVGAALMWGLVGWWVVPALIRQAYAEESLELLNAVLAGRDIHPVAFYLDAWSAIYFTATVALGLAGAIGWLALRFPGPRTRLISSLVGGAPDLSGRELLWYSVWLGALGGAGEVAYNGVRQVIVHQPAAGFPREQFWMAPLSAGLSGLLVGLAMVGLAATGRSRWQAGKATIPLGFCAVYPVIQSRGIALHPVSEVILALGVAAVLARAAESHAPALKRAIRAARPALLLASVGVLGYGGAMLPALAERRALAERPAARDGMPNILLIILDTVRAANTSLYAYGRETTPRLERWAASGSVFERAIATAPWTLPTHATVFTGRYNSELKTGFGVPLGDEQTTLAEVLAGHGYVTAGFTANLMYTTDWSGLERGFDRWEDYIPGPGLFLDSSWLSRSVAARGLRLAGIRWSSDWKSAAEVTRRSLAWISARGDRPFLAFLNFIDAHGPYLSPPEFRDRFGPPPSNAWGEFSSQWREEPDGSYTPAAALPWMNRYDGALSYVDHNLGMIQDSLAALGLLDNTIVVVTSDHGEMWGENGILGHASSLYDRVLHVPLMISFPRVVPAGSRIRPTVSLRDLPSTILDLAGLEPDELPGQTLSPLLRGDRDAPRSPAFAEVSHDATGPRWTPAFRGDMTSLFREGFHFIVNGDGVEEVYELAIDPLEQEDLSRTAGLEDLRARLRLALDSVVGGFGGAR